MLYGISLATSDFQAVKMLEGVCKGRGCLQYLLTMLIFNNLMDD